jgi:hypothetical protein
MLKCRRSKAARPKFPRIFSRAANRELRIPRARFDRHHLHIRVGQIVVDDFHGIQESSAAPRASFAPPAPAAPNSSGFNFVQPPGFWAGPEIGGIFLRFAHCRRGLFWPRGGRFRLPPAPWLRRKRIFRRNKFRQINLFVFAIRKLFRVSATKTFSCAKQ